MSHITEFSITGLSGRKTPYAHRLNRDINVFFGLNGSGKTSLLKILHSAMEGDTSGLNGVPFKSAKVKIHSDDYNKDYVLSLRKSLISPQPPFEEMSTFSSGVMIGSEYLALPRRESPLMWTTKPQLPNRIKKIKWQHL